MAEVPTTKKFYNEKGEVGVLISPGYGVGWYSWNKDHPELLFDKDIIEALLQHGHDKAEDVAIEKYGKGVYIGAITNLVVEWLPPGTLFRVDEYDGAETLITYTNDIWFKA